MDNGVKILLSCVSFLLPPVGAIASGKGVGQVLINVLLTIFGFWICGFLHALWLLWSEDKTAVANVQIQQHYYGQPPQTPSNVQPQPWQPYPQQSYPNKQPPQP